MGDCTHLRIEFGEVVLLIHLQFLFGQQGVPEHALGNNARSDTALNLSRLD